MMKPPQGTNGNNSLARLNDHKLNSGVPFFNRENLPMSRQSQKNTNKDEYERYGNNKNSESGHRVSSNSKKRIASPHQRGEEQTANSQRRGIPNIKRQSSMQTRQ